MLLPLLACVDAGLKVHNDAPAVALTSPASGASVEADTPLSLVANVQDAQSSVEELTLYWSSDEGALSGVTTIDGAIVTLELAEGLPAGDRTLTLQAIDPDGAAGEDSVELTAVPDYSPTVLFVSPEAGEVFTPGDLVQVSVTVSDAETPSEDLSLAWGGAADVQEAPERPDSAGYAEVYVEVLEEGAFVASLTVTDDAGNEATASVRFSVVDSDGDGDGHTTATDCDDDDPEISPDAEEVCNGADDDCDGTIDEDAATDAVDWYADDDGDGWGDAVATHGCEPPEGAVGVDGDCDDADPAVNPDAIEACNGWDDDCDGQLDDASATGQSTWYLDADADGSGGTSTTTACDAPSGYVADTSDCDDADGAIHPGATEVCNGADDNCDGLTDDASAADPATWYADGDGDGFGGSTATNACDAPAGHLADASDCDDGDPSVHPDASEVCNAIDDDCDGAIDDDDASVDTSAGIEQAPDSDADGWGDASAATLACELAAGNVEDATDCDDTDADVHPGAGETCDGLDEDCDGLVDDDDPDLTGASTWHPDADADGWGDADTAIDACSAPTGALADGSDCDDADAAVHPDAQEGCFPTEDADCDGTLGGPLQVPSAYATVQAGIDAAVDGDEVCVAAGTYFETIDFGGRDIALIGLDGAAATVLDGAGVGPVVTFAGGESGTLQGFTVTGGSAAQGAGIYVVGSSPTLTELIVTGNDCTSAAANCQGTGIYLYDSSSMVSDTVVSGNTQACALATPYNVGAGIYAEGGHVTLSGVDVLDNTVTVTSSGGYAWGPGVGLYGDATLEDLVIAGNTASGGGTGLGGGLVTAAATLGLSNVWISDNELATSTANGGGIYAYYATVELENVVVARNTAGQSGATASGGGLYGYYTTFSMSNAAILANTATGTNTYGGGIYLFGVSFVASGIDMVNTAVTGNASAGASVRRGGAIYTPSTAAFTTESIAYSDFYDNTGVTAFGGVIADPTGSDGNVGVDPGYTDTTAADAVDWDLTLAAGSGLLDAGDPAILDADGTRSDIGAMGGPGGG